MPAGQHYSESIGGVQVPTQLGQRLRIDGGRVDRAFDLAVLQVADQQLDRFGGNLDLCLDRAGSQVRST